MAKFLFDPSERLVAATCIDEQPDLQPGDVVHIPVRVADVTAYPLLGDRSFWLVGFVLAGESFAVNDHPVHTEVDLAKEPSDG